MFTAPASEPNGGASSNSPQRAPRTTPPRDAAKTRKPNASFVPPTPRRPRPDAHTAATATSLRGSAGLQRQLPPATNTPRHFETDTAETPSPQTSATIETRHPAPLTQTAPCPHRLHRLAAHQRPPPGHHQTMTCLRNPDTHTGEVPSDAAATLALRWPTRVVVRGRASRRGGRRRR